MKSSVLKSYLAFVFLIVCHLAAFSAVTNPITISGKIDSKDHEPVFATVYLKNSSIGTTTDMDGHYELSVPSGKHVLMVSAIGYKPIESEIQVSQEHKVFHFTLEPDVAQLNEVLVVSKSEARKEREKGFALSSVNTKKAASRNFETTELLNRTSGVKLRQSGGVGSEIQYNINGMSGNSIRIFIDGVPMENYGSSFSISSLPPSMIERIDVYKGVVPAHLTDDALGGAINVVLKKPASKAISTSYTYGSFNTHKWDLNGNYRNDKNGFTVQGSAFFNHSDNNYKVWGDPIKVTDSQTGKIERVKAERFHDAYQAKGITVNTGFTNVKWADRFLLGFIYSDMKKDIQHGATMEVVYGNRNSAEETFMGRVQYEKKNLLPNLDLSANMTYSSGERVVEDTIPYMYTWRGDIMMDRYGNEVEWQKGGGEAGKATLATNMEKTLTARTRVAYEFLPRQSISANFLMNKFTRDIKDPYLTEAQQRFTDTRHMKKMILSASYEGQFLDDRLQTGLFYKYYNQKVSLTDPIMKDGVMTADEFERSINDHGVGGTLSFKAFPNVLFTASAEIATRLPGVTELLGNTTSNVEATYDLRPEQSTNLNVGAILGTFRWGRHELDADVNFFYRDVTDMIQKSLTNLTDEMYGYENLGKIKSTGVDLDLRYQYDNKVKSELKVSYNDARFNLQHDMHGTQYIYYKDRLRNDPYFTLNYDVEYTANNWFMKESRISFNYYLGYVHEFYRNWESLGGAGKAMIPSQLVHDLGVLYTFPKKNLSISADVKNLFDEQVFDNWALQKPGRMFLVKLTYSFTK